MVPAGTVRLFTEGQAEPTALERLNGTQPHTVRVEPAQGGAGNGRYTLVLEDRDGRVLARLADVSLAGDLLALAGPALNGTSGHALEPLPAGLLHELRWQPRPLAAPGSVPVGTYVLFADDRVAEHVERSLVAGGSRVIRVSAGAGARRGGAGSVPRQPRLARRPRWAGGRPSRSAGSSRSSCTSGRAASARTSWAIRTCWSRSLARGPYSVFALIRAISRRRLGGPPALFVASTDAMPAGPGPIQPEHSAIFGLMRTIGQEYAQLRTVARRPGRRRAAGGAGRAPAG